MPFCGYANIAVGSIAQSGVAGSKSTFSWNFESCWSIVLHLGCTNVFSHRQGTTVPVPAALATERIIKYGIFARKMISQGSFNLHVSYHEWNWAFKNIFKNNLHTLWIVCLWHLFTFLICYWPFSYQSQSFLYSRKIFSMSMMSYNYVSQFVSCFFF